MAEQGQAPPPELVFDKAYFGSIFHVQTPKEKKKQKEMHVIVSWLYLDIYSENFGHRLHHIHASKIGDVTTTNGVVTIPIQDKDGLVLKFESNNPQKLKAAVTPIRFQREMAQLCQSFSVFDAMGMGKDAAKALNDKLAAAGKAFYELMVKKPVGSSGIPPCVSDVLACIFKVEHKGDTEKTIADIDKKQKLHFLLTWVDAILTATSLENIEEEYIRRIIVGLAETVITLADSLQIPTQQFASAVSFYYEQKNKLGVNHETNQIKTAAIEMLAPNTESPMLQRLYETAVVVYGARFSGSYMYNTDALRDAAVKLVLEKDEAKNTSLLDAAIRMTIGDMLRRLNNRRYDSVFQYVFALWQLRETK